MKTLTRLVLSIFLVGAVTGLSGCGTGSSSGGQDKLGPAAPTEERRRPRPPAGLSRTEIETIYLFIKNFDGEVVQNPTIATAAIALGRALSDLEHFDVGQVSESSDEILKIFKLIFDEQGNLKSSLGI